jgi:hypothetical protein
MGWTETDSLVLSIVMGLRNGLRLCHGMRRQLTEEEQFKVGRQILEQLKLSNYRIENGPPVAAHGGGFDMKPVDPP